MEQDGTHDWLIREARREDVCAILELWRQADTTPSTTDDEASVERAISVDSACVLVSESTGKLVGSIIGTFDGWRGNLYRLTVHPEYRRRGIARRLVSDAETRLFRMGARRITALVERDHDWATGFWEAARYRLDQRMVRYVQNL